MSLRGGEQAISNNVRLAEWFDEDGKPSHLAALCSGTRVRKSRESVPR